MARYVPDAGDVVWLDTGINLHGYASDFGATWIVGRAPDDTERDQFARWRAIVPTNVTADRIAGMQGKTIETTAAGVAVGNQEEIDYETAKGGKK